jgi:hypothetical protein
VLGQKRRHVVRHPHDDHRSRDGPVGEELDRLREQSPLSPVREAVELVNDDHESAIPAEELQRLPNPFWS